MGDNVNAGSTSSLLGQTVILAMLDIDGSTSPSTYDAQTDGLLATRKTAPVIKPYFQLLMP
ncbi:MAG: hypothetical protein H7203_11455 [Rhizobacter sp.]|nr:hypothetical protein [Burkholderiales bacterium]